MGTVYTDKVVQPTILRTTYTEENSAGTLLSGPYEYAQSVDVFTKERWWQRSPSKPWVYTLPYTVVRHRAWVQPYTWIATYAPNWGGTSRIWEGTCAAVDQATAHGDLYSPEFSNAATTLEDSAKNGCFDRIADTKWNTPVFFAELSKSTELVSSFAHKVDEGARILFRSARSPKKAMRALKRTFGKYAQGFKAPPGTSDAAKLWLQWRYAVQTGVLDIQNAATTTASLLLDKSNQQSQRVSCSRSTAFQLGDRVTADSSWGRSIGLGLSLGENVTHRLSRYGQVHAKAWITVERENSFLTDANQLGLLNAPLVIWELTPLSFVADWILDVGSFLDRCTAGIGFRVSAGGSSVLRQISGEHKLDVFRYYVYASRVYTGEAPTYETSVYNRWPWVDPKPIWTPKLRMTTNRWLDAASLIRQIPLGKFKAF